MLTSLLFFLVLLQIKHWYIDFVNQSPEEVASKGKYGDQAGLNHSLKHGLGTMLAAAIVTDFSWIIFVVILGLIDFATHYHIDWAKMNYGNRDIQTPAFWAHLGLDQMAHQIVYLFITWVMFV